MQLKVRCPNFTLQRFGHLPYFGTLIFCKIHDLVWEINSVSEKRIKTVLWKLYKVFSYKWQKWVTYLFPLMKKINMNRHHANADHNRQVLNILTGLRNLDKPSEVVEASSQIKMFKNKLDQHWAASSSTSTWPSNPYPAQCEHWIDPV